MASGQACLITSFFKTPSQEAEESAASESEQLTVSDVQSDSSDDNNECSSDEEFPGKPLVLNLQGLLNTSKKKKDTAIESGSTEDQAPRTVGSDLGTVFESGLEGGHKTAPSVSTSDDDENKECAIPGNPLKQSVLSWDTKNGRMVLGAPLQNKDRLVISGLAGLEGEGSCGTLGEDCTERTRGGVEGRRERRRRNQGAKERRKESALERLPLQCEDNVSEAEENDDGFMEGKKCHKKGSIILVDGSTDSENDVVLPPKRPRRSAAVSATERIASRRRSNRLRHCPQGEVVMEPESQNVTVTLEPESGNMEIDSQVSDSEVVDDSILFISSTTSPVKAVPKDLLQQTPVVSSGSLSAEWARIFCQPNKSKPPETEVIELITTEEDESVLNSPEQKQTRKHTPRSRSRRCGHTPRISPKRSDFRNRSNSPRSPRRNSPISSPRRNSLKQSGSSPLKESLLSRRQLLFSQPTKKRGARFDSAPFTELVHVQQRQSGERFWQLEAPTSVIPLRSVVSQVSSPHGSLGICVDLDGGKRMATPQLRVCSEGEKHRVLRQLEKDHPCEKVAAIFKRYERITQSARGNRDAGQCRRRSSDVGSGHLGQRGREALNTSKKNRGQSSDKHSTFNCTCSIKIRMAEDMKKIQVDASAYKQRRPRNSKRRTSQKSKVSKKQEQVSNDFPRPFQSELWTDMYRPQQSSEVIGNMAQVTQFYSWLEEWRTRCYNQMEEGRAGERNGTSKKQDKPPRATPAVSSIPWWVNEQDNDFVSVDHVRRKRSYLALPDDSEGEEGGDLSPVMLVCGMHGCGKTATVYACAEELGFKVLEVNSTTVRSRQNVLSTLREATLSHQVVTHSRRGGDNQRDGDNQRGGDKQGAESASSHESGRSTSDVRKQPSGGLYSFFKPDKEKAVESMEGVKRSGKDKEPKIKHRRKSSAITISSSDELPSTEHAQCSSTIALAKATVILLEEVDILFEEDRGFWSAVYEIIAATKRPIIMTCNDVLFELDCEYEKLVFTRPSMRELSLHMQLLCLAHGGHVTSKTANQIALFLSCDIRKVMNCLQFWLSELQRGSLASQQVSTSRSDDQDASISSPDHQDVPGDDGSDLVVSLEHLLGLSRQERDLVKSLQQQKTLERERVPCEVVLCDMLEMVHHAGLGLTSPLTGCNQVHQAVPEVSNDEKPCLSMPWRYPHKTSNSSLKYNTLDTLSNKCDNLSYMDTMRSCDCHVTGKEPDVWWKCEPSSDLSDELPLNDCNAVVAQTTCRIRTTLETLMMLECRHPVCFGDVYGLTWQEEESRRLEKLHSAQQQCSEVFTLHSELSRSAMFLDCLPALQLICQFENFREETNAKRRFRHYLQASIVDLPVLKAFARTANFSSEL